MRYIQTNNTIFIRHIFDETKNIKWNELTNTSVRKLSESQRSEFGISRLKMVTPPFIDINTHIREEGDAILVDGVWTQNWIITELPEDIKNLNIRQTRDSKLLDSDWMALSDITLSAEMAYYRQALRDIPAQAGFPDNIDWPVNPIV